MRTFLKLWAREPAAIVGVVEVVVNLLAVFGVFELTADQLAALNAAIITLGTSIIRAYVTPVLDPRLPEGP